MIRINGPNQIRIQSQKKDDFFIFIDMDGVISYWMKDACKLCGVDLDDKEIRDKLKSGIRLEDMGIVSDEEMWSLITEEGEDFWANLELFPWSKELVRRMEKLGDVFFLTSPGSCIHSPSGKMEWIKEHFGIEYMKKTIITKHKYMCAAPNRVLIDDEKNKVQKFREFGGHAFIWPDCLCLLDGDKDVNGVTDKLEKIVRSLSRRM